jgi:diguanylate cyclase (GGDEF)-like protein/PAS domain S-box-containing protein
MARLPSLPRRETILPFRRIRIVADEGRTAPEGAVAHALRASEDRFRALVEQSIVGIFLIQDGKVVYANPKFAEIYGYPQEEFLQGGIPIEQLTYEADVPAVRDLVRRELAGEAVGLLETYRGKRKDGTAIEVEAHGALTELSGRPAVIGTLLDVTERRRTERALRESEERYALAARGANDGLWDWDLVANRVYLSPRWKAMLGLAEGDIGGNPDAWLGRVHPDDHARLTADIAAHVEGRSAHLETEIRIRHADGTWRTMLVRGAAVRDASGKATRMAGSQTDITDRKRAEEKLLHDALHDGLTGLPNRALFMDRVGQAMAFQARRSDYRFAVLMLDVDRFKTVNESLGHAMGDRLLTSVAKRVWRCVRPGDTVARLSGDEFAVLLEDYAVADEPRRVADRVIAEMAPPHDLGGTEVFTSASVGVAVGRPEMSKPDDLLRDADVALYRAKDLGRSRYVVYHPSMRTRAREQLQFETDLRRAVGRNELRVLFQPIVSLTTGLPTGCEALVEWQHPGRGRIPPSDFIPMAEETGLILPIGNWVLRESCKQVKAWAGRCEAGPTPTVSVNLSARQLLHAELVDQVRAAISDAGIVPGQLRLEVTESVIMENAGPASLLLTQLKALGVHLLIDDFGTGYSSLSYLHNFRFDTLKIDRSFVSRIDTAQKNVEIVRTILSLSRALGMTAVAEGVETEGQVAQLQILKCDSAQGFYFSRGLEGQHFAAMLSECKKWKLPLASAADVAHDQR